MENLGFSCSFCHLQVSGLSILVWVKVRWIVIGNRLEQNLCLLIQVLASCHWIRTTAIPPAWSIIFDHLLETSSLMVLITALLCLQLLVKRVSLCLECPPLACVPGRLLHNIPGCIETLLPGSLPWLPPGRLRYSLCSVSVLHVLFITVPLIAWLMSDTLFPAVLFQGRR